LSKFPTIRPLLSLTIELDCPKLLKLGTGIIALEVVEMHMITIKKYFSICLMPLIY
jgi:hypothetical protein